MLLIGLSRRYGIVVRPVLPRLLILLRRLLLLNWLLFLFLSLLHLYRSHLLRRWLLHLNINYRGGCIFQGAAGCLSHTCAFGPFGQFFLRFILILQPRRRRLRQSDLCRCTRTLRSILIRCLIRRCNRYRFRIYFRNFFYWFGLLVHCYERKGNIIQKHPIVSDVHYPNLISVCDLFACLQDDMIIMCNNR